MRVEERVFGVPQRCAGAVRAMKNFSLYDCALQAMQGTVKDLGVVSQVSRREFDERPTFLFRARVPCLEYFSLLIENALLLRTHRRGRVYAGFQRLSLMEPVVDLYMRIADLSERVFVLGEPDWCPPRHPHMRVIKLPGDVAVAHERFVIASSPTLCAAIVGVDEDPATITAPDAGQFSAVKSNDPKVVARLADAAEDLIDDVLAEAEIR